MKKARPKYSKSTAYHYQRKKSEIHVRGRNVMRGYYRAPELTAKVIDSEGWFNTGDLARFNGNCLYIVGRTPARCESMSSRPVCMATDLLPGRR